MRLGDSRHANVYEGDPVCTIPTWPYILNGAPGARRTRRSPVVDTGTHFVGINVAVT